ncbi:hypothetical protein DS901_18240 [Loktanella sp. D2R18]|uniref:anti-sigma factor family protein n=1 Tax=Rhodobacterales TaxID=204455 RepID=UPI000DEAED2D|nr:MULTISPECIES: zf-HC2 domain-containing protein [Rhodobacterales]MDO6590533.1 zf-HC2 domain-containing protein [Yoonia sp. 1_MG-2023]RBW41250.1 hypothetical protein DS901_18240 [Loktanella sp. D2R18]
MKSHNTKFSRDAGCPDHIWELIPWYVNGSLPQEQAEAVELHGETCPACAAEIGRQRTLAKDVVKVDPFEVPLSRSWETLRAQIEAENWAMTPKVEKRRFAGLHGGIIALIGTVAVACLLVVAMPVQTDFDMLTSAPDTATDVIKLQLAPNMVQAQLEQVLSEFGSTLIAGPSENGVYTITVEGDADLQAVADALMSTPEIAFAAPELAE